MAGARTLRASVVGAYRRKADLRGASPTCANVAWAALDRARLPGADLTGALGLAEAFADGIDVGPERHPEILDAARARAWLLQASSAAARRSPGN